MIAVRRADRNDAILVTKMGRKKILIQRISSKRTRDNTFRKRYPGLRKKAHELGVLCDQDVFLFVRDRSSKRICMYSSTDERFIPDYDQIREQDRKGPTDMVPFYTSRPASRVDPVRAPLLLRAALSRALPRLLQESRRGCQLLASMMQVAL